MKALIAAPFHDSQRGNGVTATRWQRFLSDLGHEASIRGEYSDEDFQVLIALHARRSHASMVRFRDRYPKRPIVLALTGTDLYRDIHSGKAGKPSHQGDALNESQVSLSIADRFVVLQPLGLDALEPNLRDRVHVIFQSCEPPKDLQRPVHGTL